MQLTIFVGFEENEEILCKFYFVVFYIYALTTFRKFYMLFFQFEHILVR